MAKPGESGTHCVTYKRVEEGLCEKHAFNPLQEVSQGKLNPGVLLADVGPQQQVRLGNSPSGLTVDR